MYYIQQPIRQNITAYLVNYNLQQESHYLLIVDIINMI